MSGAATRCTLGLPTRRVALAGLVAITLVWVAGIAYRLGWWRTGALDVAWNRSTGPAAGPVGRTISEFLATAGSGAPAIVVAVVLAMAIGWRRGPYWGLVALAISSLSALQVTLLKSVAARARPDSAYGLDNAFPSGHTTNAAVVASLVVVLLLRGRARWLLLYPLLMGWSRTVLHAHWPTDVTAGTLLGVSTVVVLVHLAETARRNVLGRADARIGALRRASGDRT